MPKLEFLLPGDPATRTGGYLYDRRIAEGLTNLGWQVRIHALDASFPHPSAAALAEATGILGDLPAGSRVVIDGLALGGMPESVQAERHRLRLIALIHHPLAEETGLGSDTRARLRRDETQALAAVRRVIVTSASTARALEDYAVAPEAVVVVEPGTDSVPASTPQDHPPWHLLCVATLVPRKGHAVLCDALASLRDRPWRLTCAGSTERDPATAAALRQRIARLGLGDRVELLGEVADTHLQQLYRQAHLFVLASFHEGYGMALAEALAHGLPVVSTRAGAIPETVPPQAGLLVPSGDVPGLAQALEQVLSQPAKYEWLREGARRARAALPTWSQACARFARAVSAV